MKTTTKQSKDVIQDTKEYIINTARCLFSEFSYLGVSMNDIAKRLNITKAALYYHFASKKEIYREVLDDVFNDLNLIIFKALNAKTANEKLHQFIKGYLEFGFKEKNLIKALMLKLSSTDSQITKYIIQLREQVADLIQPVIKEVVLNKKSAKKADERLLASLLIGMMDGLLLEFSFLNKKIDSKKVSNQIIAILF
jgi:AcrR family transcriptional regulator